MQILNESEVRALAENELQGAFDACEAAFRYYGEARDVLSHPSSAFMTLPRDKPAICRIKGAHLASMGVAGARLAAPGYYYCWLIDFDSGKPIALVAEDWLHRRRTAITGALAARWLARPGARTAALIGAGKIGREFVLTLTHALALDELRIASGSGDSAKALVKDFGTTLGQTRLTAASSIEQAVRGADVVVTITKAKEAFLQPGWLAQGALLLSMGGVPEVAFGVLDEIDRLIVDDIDYALAQGDLHAWVSSGAISKQALLARIDADIGEVAIGAKPGRNNDHERILAVIQGMAVCDLAMAKMVHDRAQAEGVGQSVTI
jgi:ornithine cyclodeaminase